MRRILISVMLAAMVPSMGFAQTATSPAPQTKMFSPGLITAGGVAMVVGLVLVVPKGDDVKLGSSRYCVSSVGRNYSIQSGKCMAYSTKFGLIALAAGGGMMMIGSISVKVKDTPVTVSPMVSPTAKGARVLVSW